MMIICYVLKVLIVFVLVGLNVREEVSRLVLLIVCQMLLSVSRQCFIPEGFNGFATVAKDILSLIHI